MLIHSNPCHAILYYHLFHFFHGVSLDKYIYLADHILHGSLVDRFASPFLNTLSKEPRVILAFVFIYNFIFCLINGIIYAIQSRIKCMTFVLKHQFIQSIDRIIFRVMYYLQKVKSKLNIPHFINLRSFTNRIK